MKRFILVLSILVAFWPAIGRALEQAALGTPYLVSSYHWTTSDGIQSFGATSLMSPSGQWYSEETHFGLDAPDGSSSQTVTLNEVGIWQVWHGFGYAAPQSASTWYQPDISIQVGSTNSAPTISWTSAPTSAGHGASYTVSASGHDDDGNLTQVNVWKDGVPFAFAGGGNGTDGDSGNTTSDGGPTTITFTAQAVDGDGATSAVISHVVTINAPPPAPTTQYTLAASAGPGGTVSPGGVFAAGTTATIVATPDFYHDFAGWSGDAGGTVNPAGILMDRDKGVQALFTWKQFALSTSATSGGSVTPGGSYPYGSIVTLSATPDATSRFTGWTGAASGTSPSVAVTINGPLSVQALFAPKNAQTITFNNPGSRPAGTPPFALDGTSSSGLPVIFTVVSGPATYSGGQLRISGSGPITVQASQAGDSLYLPAPVVTQTFNSVAPVVLKYSGAARTVLQSRATGAPANLVLETP